MADLKTGSATLFDDRPASGSSSNGASNEMSIGAASLTVTVSRRLHEVPPSTVAEWVREVVEAESPVHREGVARRILDAAGVTRLGRRIKESFRDEVEQAERNE